MAIQIHQLNELTSPSMSDYLAEDTGADTGKVSVSALAGAILKDYEATFGNGDTASIIDEIDTKVSKAGDTMTGSLAISASTASQRVLRLQNTVRNVCASLNVDGNFGFYDDTNGKWILYDQPGTDYLVINEGIRATSFTSTTNPTVISATPSEISSVATGSWVNVASITLPYVGTYIVTGSLLISGAAGSVCGARLDSSSGNCRQSYTIPNGNIHGVSVSDIMYGTANQTVTIQVYCTGTINILSGGRLKAVRIM